MEKTRKRAAGGGDGRDRPRKAPKPVFDRTIQPPAGLVAKNPPPQPKLKHQAYFEFVENTNKKKQLDYQITVDREPPPGFAFVPIGNPELTTLCKEISREKDAMIFMVSTSRDNTNELSLHTSRVGHHIREAIVEEAHAALGYRHGLLSPTSGEPEPIPKTQHEINAQADAALRELFPRIPNTDRQEIIDHAFRKGATFHGDPVVGLSKDISLSRRVQLAVLAHIRHRHTRYDALLKETTWQHARKTVEEVCLDMIVKWRGDEENGRDTLDSILREVVVISDSEDDGESDDDSDELIIVSPRSVAAGQKEPTFPAAAPSVNSNRSDPARNAPTAAPRSVPRKTPATPGKAKRTARALRRERREAKKATRGFKRYQAAWEEAVDRHRHDQDAGKAQPSGDLAAQRSPSYEPPPPRPDYGAPAQAPYHPHHAHSNSDVIYLGPARRPETANPGPPAWVDGHYSPRPPNMPPDSQIAPLPVQSRMGEGRAPIMTRSRTNPSIPVERSRAHHYQDLLVPSIETPPSAAMAPQFVRPVPSRKRTRDESPGHSARYPAPQTFHSAYPAEVVQDGHVKRRRVVSDRNGTAVPVPLSDSHPPNPPHPPHPHHGHSRHEPESRQPFPYAGMDTPRVLRDPLSHQVPYGRHPEPVEIRQQPIAVRQPPGAIPPGSEMREIRPGVQDQAYRTYQRGEPLPEQPRQYWDAPIPTHRPGYHGQSSQLTRPTSGEHPSIRYEAQQFSRPAAQPIFVRTVEPRTMEVRTRTGAQGSRHATPGNAMPPRGWEEPAAPRAEYPARGRTLEPFYEVNRQPTVAPPERGVPTTRPYLEEPIRVAPRPQQPRPPVLPHAGRPRPVPPRDVVVFD